MSRMESNSPSFTIEMLGSQTAPYQWLRELIHNSLEAGATTIEIDPTNQVLASAYGAPKMMIWDNGAGMSRKELRTYMRALHASGKQMGGAAENLGIGAKISTLLWNTLGVIYISVKDGERSMVWLHRSPETNEFEIRDVMSEDLGYPVDVLEPTEITADGVTVDWTQVIPSEVLMAGHGTAVVLLGDTKDQDVRLGDLRVAREGWRLENGVKVYRNLPEWNYINARYMGFGPAEYGDYTWAPTNPAWAGTEIRIKAQKENFSPGSSSSDTRRARGALAEIFRPTGSGTKPTVTHGVITLTEASLPCKIHWFIRDEPLPQRPHSWYGNADLGYLAVLYQSELYEHGRQRFRSFGIPYREVQDRVFLIFEPVAADEKMSSVKGTLGVRNNAVRSGLLWGDNYDTLPWDEWARWFREEGTMPQPIVDAIHEFAASLPTAAGLDPETINRIASYLDDVYPVDRVRRSKNGTEKLQSAGGTGPGDMPSEGGLPPKNEPTGVETGNKKGGSHSHKPSATVKTTGSGVVNSPGTESGQRYKKYGSLPRLEWTTVESLEEPGKPESLEYGVVFTEPSGAEPGGLVQVARDHWALKSLDARISEEFQDNPAVTGEALIQAVQNAVGGDVLSLVGLLMRRRTVIGDVNTWEAMTSPLSLTSALISAETTYRDIKARLAGQFGSTKKIKKVA